MLQWRNNGNRHRAEDHTFTDSNDDTIDLANDDQKMDSIGLIHPLEKGLHLSNAWVDIWMDYELFSPFPQLDRDTYTPTEDEKQTGIVTRFKEIAVPATVVVHTLESQGWERNVDRYSHWKHFPEQKLTAALDYDTAVDWWGAQNSGDVRISGCYFSPLGQSYKRLPLASIDPIIFSETLRQLTLLTAGARK